MFLCKIVESFQNGLESRTIALYHIATTTNERENKMKRKKIIKKLKQLGFEVNGLGDITFNNQYIMSGLSVLSLRDIENLKEQSK